VGNIDAGDARAGRRFLGSGAPIPFAPDGSAQGALTTRLGEADAALKTSGHPKAKLTEELDAHQAAVGSAYSARPLVPHYSGAYVERSPLLGGISGTSKNYNLFEYETQVLQPLIDESNLLLEELAFS
jgi:hypothetical protein